MIDWVKVRYPMIAPPLEHGRVQHLDRDGVITCEYLKPLTVESSQGAKLRVRSVGSAGDGLTSHLEVSGNPAKFLQGHNVFGSDDVISLCAQVFGELCASFGLKPSDQEAAAVASGIYPITWVDINYSYALCNQADVQAWIKAAEYTSRTRRGRPVLTGTTLYWSKHSRRWGIKAYSKYVELATKGGKLPTTLPGVPDLMGWAQNKLRLEVRLLSMELARLGIKTVRDLSQADPRAIHNQYRGKIIMAGNYAATSKEISNLSKSVRSSYRHWENGLDVLDVMSKAKFYRHRKIILDALALDISIQKASAIKPNVVPLVRVLEAVEAEIPGWAYEMNLVA